MLGVRLKSLRINSKLTQADMAEKTDFARTTYAMYEQDKREPDNKTLNRIANYFQVSADYLLGRTDNPNPPNEEFNPMDEINRLLEKHEIDQSSFFDIEKWKALGPEGIRQLAEYFEFITKRARNGKDEGK